MRLHGKKEIQVVKRMRIGGEPYNTGDVVAVSEEDALYLVASGRAMSYPPPATQDDSPEDLAERRKEALNSGPYKVEIMRRCLVKGFECLPGEVISVDENDAMCLATFSGKIIETPPMEESIEEMVRRMIEEQLQRREI